MKIRSTTTGALALLVLAASGCSSSTAGKGSQPVTPPRYTTPNQMISKLRAAGFDCATDYPGATRSTYDAAGALRLFCSHGRAREAVVLETFPTTTAQSSERAATGAGKPAHWDNRWAVVAQSPATLRQAVRILTA